MEYKGKVYAKINGKYIECTESVNDLESKIEVLQKDREDLKEALRLTHNKIYTLYHTPNSIKRKDLEIDLVKAFFVSGNCLFNENRFIINENWNKQPTNIH